MEELFKQSFTYANIRVFKNYSNLGKKSVLCDTVYDPEAPKPILDLDPLKWTQVPTKMKKYVVSAINKEEVYDTILYPKDSKHFFYTTNPTDSYINHAKMGSPTVKCEKLKLVNAKHIKKAEEVIGSGCTIDTFPDDYFETSKDRHIKQFFNNPFANITIHKLERWIRRDDNKITLKFYSSSRNRNINSIYFRKMTNSTTVTINRKTGNFTVVVYTSGKKGVKQKHFYSNSFNSLESQLPVFYTITGKYIKKTSSLYKEFNDSFDIFEFQKNVENILGLEGISFESDTEILVRNFITQFIPKFVELKKIKVPDDGKRLIKYHYPTEKFLKKNDRKLVASVLDRYGIKSKVTVKLLHQSPQTKIEDLVTLCRLFGNEYPKYIGNICDFFFSDNTVMDVQADKVSKHNMLDPERTQLFELKNTEKEAIVHILNDLCEESPLGLQVHNAVGTFVDHFQMMKRAREFFPDLQLNARKWDSFNAEHTNLAKIEREIKRGYSIEFVFEPAVIKDIEKPIEVTTLIEPPVMFLESARERVEYKKQWDNFPVSAVQRVFQPVLLKTTDDYFDEGFYMNHCVAGYTTHTWSVIISLRLGKERVTCEFSIKDKRCSQARYFSNQNPPEYFFKALDILKERVRTLPFPIGPVEEKQVPLILNGVELTPDHARQYAIEEVLF